MIEVEITNYQSIAHTKIQIEGFTTLIGRNYLGKSAVLRAINAVLTNQQGTDFIRWGQTFCEVHIKFPDLDILWHKEDGNNFYRINNVEYKKIGKDEPPKEITEAGFKPLLIGDQKINLNYAVQFFPLFLLDKQDSRGADILTSVYGLDRVYKAIELCNKEQRANADILRIREKDLKLLEDNLEKFKDFPNLIIKIDAIKQKNKDLRDKEENIAKIKLWGDSFKNLYQSCKKLKPVIAINIPQDKQINSNISGYQKVVIYKTSMDKIVSFLKRIKPALSINISDKKVFEIKGMLSEYQRILKWTSNYNKLSKELNNFQDIDKINLPTVNIDTQELTKMQHLADQMNNLRGELIAIKNSVESLSKEEIKLQENLNNFDICPLCGQTVKR